MPSPKPTKLKIVAPSGYDVVAKRMTNKREPKPEAVAAWDAKLRARVKEEIAAGRRVQFSVAAFQQRFEVISVDEAGTLDLKGAVTEMNMEWPRLMLADKKSLALAVLREGSPEDHCLAAFFLNSVQRFFGVLRHHVHQQYLRAFSCEAQRKCGAMAQN